MNPWLIRVGIGVAVSAAAFLYSLWRIQRKVREPSYVHVNPGNYDASDDKICCICLTEFKLCKTHEVISLPCRHKICRNCCKTMFSFEVRNRRKCPQCRRTVPEEFVSLII